MGNASVAHYSAERLQGPKAHIPSRAAWRCHYSTQIPKIVDELPICEVTGGAESHSGQSRQRDSRSRRGKSLNATATSQAGPLLENRPQSKSGAPGLDTKTRNRRTTATGYSHYPRPSTPNFSQTCTRTRVGSQV